MSAPRDAAQRDLDATNIRNQLPGKVLPPASATTRGGVTLSDDDPLPSDVAADPGVSSSAARADHVHPDAGGGGALSVTDGSATVAPVTDLTLIGATIADDGGGAATLTVTGGGGSGNATSTGAAGSEPGSPATGDLYFPNNGFVVERYSGSLWAPWGPLFPLAAPPVSGWSWDNQESAVVSSANGGVALSRLSQSNNLNVYYRSLPAAPYTITLGILIACNFTTGSGTENVAGVCWRDSGGKIIDVEFGHYFNNNLMRVRAWNSASSFSGQYFGTTGLGIIGPIMWVRLKDDNTNRMVQLSADGVNFFTVHSVARTDFMTANGYGLFARSVGDQSIVTLISLLEGP
jgi:hypothetical protein